MSHFTFEEAEERLTCPHASYCTEYLESYSVSASTVPNELVLEVECTNCNSRDHLTFNVGNYERTHPTVSVGDTFTIDSESTHHPANAETLTITAIADSPLYLTENCIIGIVYDRDDSPPYKTRCLTQRSFKKSLEYLEPST